MNISGIRPTESFYSYNSIKLSELRNQQIAAAKEASVVSVTKEVKFIYLVIQKIRQRYC